MQFSASVLVCLLPCDRCHIASSATWPPQACSDLPPSDDDADVDPDGAEDADDDAVY